MATKTPTEAAVDSFYEGWRRETADYVYNEEHARRIFLLAFLCGQEFQREGEIIQGTEGNVTVSTEDLCRSLSALEYRVGIIKADPRVSYRDGVGSLLREGLANDEAAVTRIKLALGLTTNPANG